MRTRDRLLFGICGFVGVVIIASVGAAGGISGPPIDLPRDVPGPGTHPGAPPPFVTPAEGRAEVSADGRVVTLRRRDGTKFAEARKDPDGRTSTSLWYDSAGDLSLIYTQDFPAGMDAPPGENTGPSEFPEPKGADRDAGTQARNARSVSCGANVSTWETYMLYPPATFTWYFNSGSTPAGLSVATTETYLRNAHAEWYNNSNWCGYADASVFSMAYGGTTTSGYGDNGINTVGFASMSGTGCAIDAVGCTRVEVAGLNVIESDSRLNSAMYSWINGQAAGKYDTWSVMAHEVGHTVGFWHVTDTSNVMNTNAFTNDTSPHLLGNGDANANNGKY
jgi:hypothetical protein